MLATAWNRGFHELLMLNTVHFIGVHIEDEYIVDDSSPRTQQSRVKERDQARGWNKVRYARRAISVMDRA
jgi:hypothetical protein